MTCPQAAVQAVKQTEGNRIGRGLAGPGRKKGVPNKISGDVKAMILGALDKAGGEKYLADQAKKNPAAFMTLVGKVLPLQVGGDPDNPFTVSKVDVSGLSLAALRELAKIAPGP